VSAGEPYSHLTEAYLSEKFPLTVAADNLLINAAVYPTEALVQQVVALQSGQALAYAGTLVAARCPNESLAHLTAEFVQQNPYAAVADSVRQDRFAFITGQDPDVVVLRHPWDIFTHNEEQLRQDYALVTQSRVSEEITDPYTRIYQPDQVFVEEGAVIRAAIINAEDGPVYIGKNATVHENAVIKGPFAMLENSHVNIGGKIREATTIGPNCKVGGEVKNTVFLANSNKGHEGFVGNSVVGEWCNFGADTNTSNLKNNYQAVRVWSYAKRAYENTGLQFCGLLMGDHSKCSINTMFNTGTVVGVFANIFGAGFPPKFVPSFTWGGTPAQGDTVYSFDKATETLDRILKRRGLVLSSVEISLLKHVFEQRNNELPN
jgi:UDP-N-acetylglucosamine diphosphorylase/glucosamine-1-phosphate N-acetyltransferase